MAGDAEAAPAASPAEAPAKKKKICCACPDTKKLRDEVRSCDSRHELAGRSGRVADRARLCCATQCIALNGEDKCAELIEAHKVCLRKEGFKV
eukprot:scaffold218_cov333-Prasinococcus_capsulatus_cf.AAC.9